MNKKLKKRLMILFRALASPVIFTVVSLIILILVLIFAPMFYIRAVYETAIAEFNWVVGKKIKNQPKVSIKEVKL